jgi:hypothetical protein
MSGFINPNSNYILRSDWLKLSPYQGDPEYGDVAYEDLPAQSEGEMVPNYAEIPFKNGDIVYYTRSKDNRPADPFKDEFVKDGVLFTKSSSHRFNKGTYCHDAYKLAKKIDYILKKDPSLLFAGDRIDGITHEGNAISISEGRRYLRKLDTRYINNLAQELGYASSDITQRETFNGLLIIIAAVAFLWNLIQLSRTSG